VRHGRIENRRLAEFFRASFELLSVSRRIVVVLGRITTMREHQGPRSPERSARRRRGRARAWFLIAFASLAGGLIAGAVWRVSDWGWVFPVGGFVAYVLAFGRALRARRPQGIDGLWRLPSSTAGPGRIPRRGVWRPDWVGRKREKVARWDFRKGPPSGERRPAGAAGSGRQG
jgi:MFS family permease